MPTLIPCPGCNRTVRLPDGWLDRQVKCPTCGTIFRGGDLPAASLKHEEEAIPLTPADESDAPAQADRPQPRRRRERAADLDDCPHCGETIRRGARECPNCGKDLIYDESDSDSDRPWDRYELRRDGEPHRGSPIFVMGLLSLIASPLAIIFACCCAPLGLALCIASIGLGIPAWAMGHGDLKKIKAGTMDPRGHGRTKTGMILGVIGSITSLFVLLATIAFVAYVIYDANNGGGGMWWKPAGMRRPGR
jgi:hypothetical protein